MGQLAKNEMVFGRNFTFDEIIRKIDAITMDDFRRVCDIIFRNNPLTLVSIGNLKDETGGALSLQI